MAAFDPRGTSLLLVTALTACVAPTEDTGPRIALIDEPRDANFATITVAGIAAESLDRWDALSADERSRVLTVRILDERGEASSETLLGGVARDADVLRFRPRFPLTPGLSHQVRFDGAMLGGGDVVSIVRLESPPAERTTRVAAVHPGTDVVPSNLLRMYVHFTAPMHARDVLRHVRLLDSDGAEVEAPFVDLEHGLWDPSRTRLTLLFHPGRVKRGIGATDEPLGPPLEPHGEYTLVIADELEDARGAQLVEAAEWSFHTTGPDRWSPEPRAWTLIEPSGPAAPLKIDFGEALDHALAGRLLAIEDAVGIAVPGSLTIAADATSARFQPEKPWRAGDYVLLVHPALEDLAGNAVGHRFEERLNGKLDRGAQQVQRLPFAVDEP